MPKRKIGRNEKCPCGSGIKYKKCCSRRFYTHQPNTMNIPPQVFEKITEIQKKQGAQLRRFGHVRPPVSTEIQGQRVVAVGSRLFWSPKWKTFHDFLVNYLATVVGKEWGDAELRKVYVDRHPIAQWYYQLCLNQQKVVKEPGELHVAIATAPVMAYMSLGYDLYTLEHHALLQDRLVGRLKHKDQFQGARYETYVTAAFIRAGFNVVLEDETDTENSHCEFVATHKELGTIYSIEAKSRHRPGRLGRTGEPQPHVEIKADVSRLLGRALKKRADHERIIFLDVNVPPIDRARLGTDFLDDIAQAIDPFKTPDNIYPPAFIVFTNHPYHYVDVSSPEPGHTAVFTGINMPCLEVGAKESPFSMYPAIAELFHSVLNHTSIPEDFDL